MHNTVRGKLFFRSLLPPSHPLAALSYPVCSVPLALCWPLCPSLVPSALSGHAFFAASDAIPLCPFPVSPSSPCFLCRSAHSAKQFAGHLLIPLPLGLPTRPLLRSGLVLPPAPSVCARTVQSSVRGIPVPTPLSPSLHLLLGPFWCLGPLRCQMIHGGTLRSRT